MTWTPPQGSSLGRGLSDEQRSQLARLEAVQRPTEYARGVLVALRICAIGPDRDRVLALTQKWANQARPT